MIRTDELVSAPTLAERVLPMARKGLSAWEISETTGLKLQSVRVSISALRARGELERTAPRRQHATIAEQIQPLFEQGLGAEEIFSRTGHNLRTVKWCIYKLRAKAKAAGAAEPVASVKPVAPVVLERVEALPRPALASPAVDLSELFQVPARHGRRVIDEREPRTDGLIDLLDLTSRTCRWPVGDPGTPAFGFCCDEVQPGCGPYCATYRLRAYARPEVRAKIDRQLNIPKAKSKRVTA